MKKILIGVGVIAVIAIVVIVITTKGPNESKGTPQTGETSEIQETVGQGEAGGGTEEKIGGETEGETGEGASGGTNLECNVGSWWTEGNVKYKITGIERYTVGGESMDLCCEEWTVEDQKNKYCWGGEDGGPSITWMTDSETGKLFKYMEIWKQDGKSCSKIFDPDGNVEVEMCK